MTATCPTHDRPLTYVALTGVRECPEPGCAAWAEGGVMGDDHGIRCSGPGCAHGLRWHHPERGCGYHGFAAESRCPCTLTHDEAVTRTIREAQSETLRQAGQEALVLFVGTARPVAVRRWLFDKAAALSGGA